MCSAADEEFIAPPVTGHVHASTLVALKDGGYFAAWFEGSKEGAQDVAIYGAARKRCTWSEKHVLAKVNPSSPHWNPVLRRADDGRIELFFKVGRNCADWRTYVQESHDEGITWSTPRELVPGDVWGGRGPVKNKCLRLRTGRWLAPASREFDPSHPLKLCFQWRAFVDISDDDGRTWRKSKEFPMPDVEADAKNPPGVIQPTLWEDDNGIHALMRANDGWVWCADSVDEGETWSVCRHTSLANINSGLDCVRASDGRIYLVLNGKSANVYGWGVRNHLEIKVSADGGKEWSTFATLADDAPKQQDGRATEFSYPAIIESRTGVLAVTFTCNRRQIAFREFVLPFFQRF
jgi:predicted neuraminidase